MSGELGEPPAGDAPVPDGGGGMALDGMAAQAGSLGLEGEVVLAGALKKKKKKGGTNWQTRWCALMDDPSAGPRFVYRKKEADKKVKGILALRGAWITVDYYEKFSNVTCVQIAPAAAGNDTGKARVFDFQAASEKERDQWLDALGSVAGTNMPINGDELCGIEFDTLEKSDDELETILVTMALNLGIGKLLGKVRRDSSVRLSDASFRELSR